MKPVVLEGIQSFVLAADDGGEGGTVPSIAHGDRQRIAQLGAVVLASIGNKLGAAAFEAVVAAARGQLLAKDITDSVRTPVAPRAGAAPPTQNATEEPA